MYDGIQTCGETAEHSTSSPNTEWPSGVSLWNTKLATNNIIRGFEQRVGHIRFCIDLWSQQVLYRALVTSGLVQSSGHIRSCTKLWSHHVLNRAQVTAGFVQSSGHSRFCAELRAWQLFL